VNLKNISSQRRPTHKKVKNGSKGKEEHKLYMLAWGGTALKIQNPKRARRNFGKKMMEKIKSERGVESEEKRISTCNTHAEESFRWKKRGCSRFKKGQKKASFLWRFRGQRLSIPRYSIKARGQSAHGGWENVPTEGRRDIARSNFPGARARERTAPCK